MKLIRRVARVGVLVLSSIFLAVVADHADAAGNVKAGREKARMCEACHGLNGVSKIPEAPNLAGQIENYMVEQLSAFKAGERKNEQMSLITGTLSRQEIEDLAAYYAAIEVTVGKVPGQ